MNPNGLCLCGCGEKTRPSTRTRVREGLVKGEPVDYIWGHSPAYKARNEKVAEARRATAGRGLPDPNPGGFCLCGCGEPTPLAKRTRLGRNQVKGRHLPYLRRHEEYASPPVLDPMRGCLVWQGALNGDGRPFKVRRIVNGQPVYDHPYRVAWLRHFGSLPATKVLHHKCLNPACVEISHLEPLTPSEHSSLHHKLAALSG